MPTEHRVYIHITSLYRLKQNKEKKALCLELWADAPCRPLADHPDEAVCCALTLKGSCASATVGGLKPLCGAVFRTTRLICPGRLQGSILQREVLPRDSGVIFIL